MVVFGALVVWMLLFLLLKWNEKLVKRTVTDTVPSAPSAPYYM